MCGRFSLTSEGSEVARLFDLETVPTLSLRYNIAPTQEVAAVRETSATHPRRELVPLVWGLVPSWAKDPAIGAKMINARSETVTEKPSFRTAFRRRRCLIPASGFYEWARTGSSKQPYYIRVGDGEPFAMAGLWDIWEKGGEAVIESCTILTTDANDLMRPIHHRMPVILRPESFDAWLDPTVERAEMLTYLLSPYPSEEMSLHPVSAHVNNPRNDDPECAQPLT